MALKISAISICHGEPRASESGSSAGMEFRRKHKRSAFSLVESIASILIIGLTLTAALNTIGGVARARKVQTELHEGRTLALQLMTEIMQARYEETASLRQTTLERGASTTLVNAAVTPLFGPENSETNSNRWAFDDVDDYHNWVSSPPEEKDGLPLTGKDGWTRAVMIENVPIDDPAGSAVGTDTGLKRITITVTDDRGRVTTLVGLRSRFGAYEERLAADTNMVDWVGVKLEIGGRSNQTMTASTCLLNGPKAVP